MPALSEEDQKQLGEVVTLIRQSDAEGVATRLGNLLTRLVSGIPLLGSVAEEGARALIDRTSWGRLKKEVALVTAETTQLEAAQQVAGLVAELLREALYGLHSDHQAITAALARLDAQLESAKAELAGRDRIHQKLVDGGSTGVVLEGGERRAVEVKQDRVTQRGTIGVHIKAKPPR